MIEYKQTKKFEKEEIERLFLSVGWTSGKHPDKIVRGLEASSTVISAWDEGRLIGLIRGLDDGETVGFIHYLLVDPAYQGKHIGQELMNQIMEKYKYLLHVKVMPSSSSSVNFYKRFGFEIYDNYSALEKNQENAI